MDVEGIASCAQIQSPTIRLTDQTFGESAANLHKPLATTPLQQLSSGDPLAVSDPFAAPIHKNSNNKNKNKNNKNNKKKKNNNNNKNNNNCWTLDGLSFLVWSQPAPP
ncbi:unnamed protein product [Polarella glacialis]|uniref:Uncharacterized protein n=1 Tax=Polarella glacialis TaxID=89957 RepID=A0A813E1K6_POLGL|nr:unnamed protein product [Polarella glacialis]CAE8646032.1 unnamed protein product [Polarella glacialis]